MVNTWDCPFCHCKNGLEAQNCLRCGAHIPVDMSMADVHRLVQKPRPRIAGLRGSVFMGAAVCFCLAAFQYDRIQETRVTIAQYHTACDSDMLPACTSVPAAYTTSPSATQGSTGIVEITPAGQGTYPVSADISRLPQSGQGAAIFWRGKLTALSTPFGIRQTNFSPVNDLVPEENLVLFWVLLGINGTLLPFIRGWAFRLDYEIAEDGAREPKSHDHNPGL